MDSMDPALLDWAAAVADEIPPDDGASTLLDGRYAGTEVGKATHAVERIASAFRSAAALADPSRRPVETPAFRWGSLEVYERLGEGSQAEVFRAIDPRLGRTVALKLAAPTGLEAQGGAWRFLDEARRLAAIRSDNIVTVLGADLNANRAGFWMELVEGLTLEDILADRGALSVTEVVEIGRALCAALGAIHRAGFLHGDLKASNVMREDTGRIVLVDFGAATEFSAGQPPGLRFGTPVSLAPEVFLGSSPSVQSDIYALGVLLFRLLTNAYPLDGESIEEIDRAHRAGAYQRLEDLRPGLPKSLDETVHRAFAAKPDERYADTETLAQALQSCTRPRGNLLSPASSFIGRVVECGRVAALLSKHRLVTVSGPGGIGKSRLSYEVAGTSRRAFSDDAWLCDLSAVEAPTGVWSAVSDTVGVEETAGQPVEETTVQHLASMHALLLLDGCEHLMPDISRVVQRLLEACPRLTLLATSRQPLGLSSEAVLPLTGMDVDEAASLLRSRAELAGAPPLPRPSAGPAGEDTEQVRALCRQLDGIPLAIELAAAQLVWLSLADLEKQIETEAVSLGADQAIVPRHRTLRAVIDWSHRLLDADERTVFRRLAVMADGWTLEDAAQIVDVPEARRVIGQLTRRSLVETVPAGTSGELATEGPRRFRMLATLRQYALERLHTAGEAESLGWRHSDHYARVAIAARERMRAGEADEATSLLAAEGRNLIRALEWRLPRKGGDSAIETTAAFVNSLAHYWFPQGRLTEARDAYRRFLAAGDGGRTPAWAGAWMGAGVEAWERGDLEDATQRTERALSIYRELGAHHGVSLTLGNLALVEFDRRNHERSRALLEESLALAREQDDAFAEGDALLNLGALYLEMADFDTARAFMDEAQPILEKDGSDTSVCRNLLNRTRLELLTGHIETARGVARRALVVARRSFDRPDLAVALFYFAQTCVDEDRSAATDALYRSIEVAKAAEETACLAEAWAQLAELHLDAGDRVEAAHCLDACVRAVNGESFRDRDRVIEVIVRTGAYLAARQKQWDQAAWRWAWSEAATGRSGRVFSPRSIQRAEALRALLESHLPGGPAGDGAQDPATVTTASGRSNREQNFSPDQALKRLGDELEARNDEWLLG